MRDLGFAHFLQWDLARSWIKFKNLIKIHSLGSRTWIPTPRVFLFKCLGGKGVASTNTSWNKAAQLPLAMFFFFVLWFFRFTKIQGTLRTPMRRFKAWCVKIETWSLKNARGDNFKIPLPFFRMATTCAWVEVGAEKMNTLVAKLWM